MTNKIFSAVFTFLLFLSLPAQAGQWVIDNVAAQRAIELSGVKSKLDDTLLFGPALSLDKVLQVHVRVYTDQATGMVIFPPSAFKYVDRDPQGNEVTYLATLRLKDLLFIAAHPFVKYINLKKLDAPEDQITFVMEKECQGAVNAWLGGL